MATDEIPNNIPEDSNDPLGLSHDESARLKELKDALESEFLTNEEAAKDSGGKAAIQSIEELKPDFLSAIKHVVKHSDSHALRAKVAMWGMDKLIDQAKAKAKPEELVDIIKGMEAARAYGATASQIEARANNEDGS